MSTTLSPFIVGATGGDYTTIQAAINAAAALSPPPSGSNQVNIYIKPKGNGLTGYTENLTLRDGINLIGFGETNYFLNKFPASSNIPQVNFPGVIVNGTVTVVGSAQCKIQGITFRSSTASGSIFTLTGSAELQFLGCFFSLNASSISMITGSTYNPVLSLVNCAVGGTTPSGIILNYSGGNCFLECNGCNFFTSSVKLLGNNTNPTLSLNSTYLGAIDASTITASSTSLLTVRANQSYFGASTASPTATLLTASSQCTLNVQLDACEFLSVSSTPVLTGGKSTGILPSQVILNDCICTGQSSSSNPVFSVSGFCQQNNLLFNNANNITRQDKLINSATSATAFSGSEWVTTQTGLQTTDATTQTLASVSLNQNETITFKGTITADQSDSSNMVGGDFLLCARRSSGNITLIGTPVVNLQSSSNAYFSCDVDTTTQTARVRVTGVAATTYNWVCTYSYQKALTNT